MKAEFWRTLSRLSQSRYDIEIILSPNIDHFHHITTTFIITFIIIIFIIIIIISIVLLIILNIFHSELFHITPHTTTPHHTTNHNNTPHHTTIEAVTLLSFYLHVHFFSESNSWFTLQRLSRCHRKIKVYIRSLRNIYVLVSYISSSICRMIILLHICLVISLLC